MLTLFVAVVAITAANAAPTCPTISPMNGLDLDEWLRKTWYVTEQQVTGYLHPDSFYCVTATYNVTGDARKKKVPFFKGTVIGVHNYDNHNVTNGPATNTDKEIPGGLCARAENASLPSKLLVAPCFIPNLLAGNYWVLDVGMDNNGHYTWGIISGGQPTEKFADGCTTKETGQNGSGLWIFVRDPAAARADSQEVIAAKKRLHALGFTTSRLMPIDHKGCEYNGAVFK